MEIKYVKGKYMQCKTSETGYREHIEYSEPHGDHQYKYQKLIFVPKYPNCRIFKYTIPAFMLECRIKLGYTDKEVFYSMILNNTSIEDRYSYTYIGYEERDGLATAVWLSKYDCEILFTNKKQL